MQITILESSLHDMVNKAMELAKEGYSLEQATMMGWMYELQLTKQEEQAAPVDRMAKARAARGQNGNKE